MEVILGKCGVTRYKEKVYLSNGRTLTKTFKRRTDAVLWKSQKILDRDRNTALGIEGLKENVSFTFLFEHWLETKIAAIRSLKTLAEYRSVGRQHLLPELGQLMIRSVGKRNAEMLFHRLKSKGLQNATANKAMVVLKQVLGFAESQGYIAKNPIFGFPMLPRSKGRVDYLTSIEIERLLASPNSDPIYPLVLLALNTGMRIGELTGLCWDRVHFDVGTIEVSRAMTRLGLKQSTKTNLTRFIPMNTSARECLEELRNTSRGGDFVFTTRSGGPYNPDHFSRRQLSGFLERAGVRNVSCHVLRHTYASHFMMNGGQLYDLQRILGHTKMEMTMVYAHLSPQHLRNAAQTVCFERTLVNSSSPSLALERTGTETWKAKRICKALQSFEINDRNDEEI